MAVDRIYLRKDEVLVVSLEDADSEQVDFLREEISKVLPTGRVVITNININCTVFSSEVPPTPEGDGGEEAEANPVVDPPKVPQTDKMETVYAGEA